MKALFDRQAAGHRRGCRVRQPQLQPFRVHGHLQSAERRHRRGRGGSAAGSTRTGSDRCARLASARPCRSPSPGRKVQGRRSPPATPAARTPASRPSTPPWPRRLGASPRLLAARASADAQPARGRRPHARADPEPHCRQRPAACEGQRLRCAPAGVERQRALDHRQWRGGTLECKPCSATPAQHRGQPDPGRCGHRGLQASSSAGSKPHAAARRTPSPNCSPSSTPGQRLPSMPSGDRTRARDGGPRLHRVRPTGPANARRGRDHGWANVVLVAGHPVKGGFYGDPPSLTNLSEGNLVYTTTSAQSTPHARPGARVDPKVIRRTFTLHSLAPGDSTHLPQLRCSLYRNRRDLAIGHCELGMHRRPAPSTVEGDPCPSTPGRTSWRRH